MNFKIGVISILLSTIALIGLINIALNHTPKTAMPLEIPSEEKVNSMGEAPAKVKALENRPVLNKKISSNSVVNTPKKELASTYTPPPTSVISDLFDDDDDDDDDDDIVLTKKDIEEINGIATLSENKLKQELDLLKNRIKEEDLFTKLEAKNLSADKEKETKEILERFALLGLESTRRKYMEIDPELNDALAAHSEGLKEIRALLNE